jgi:hypothetical protein
VSFDQQTGQVHTKDEGDEKLSRELDNLEKQKKILKQANEATSKKMDTILNEKKKQYNTLIYRKAEIFKSLKDKTVDLQSKGGEIQELIEKAKVGSDASTLELLRRWEDANNDVLKKNEE